MGATAGTVLPARVALLGDVDREVRAAAADAVRRVSRYAPSVAKVHGPTLLRALSALAQAPATANYPLLRTVTEKALWYTMGVAGEGGDPYLGDLSRTMSRRGTGEEAEGDETVEVADELT